MSTPNLSEFDEIGLGTTGSSESPTHPEQPVTAIPENPVKANEPNNSNSPKKSAQNNPPSPKKMVIGCLFFFFIIFVILVIAMVFGLSAGESTITSFGLNPASFKNGTIGIVSIFFGLITLVNIILIVFHLGAKLLAPKENIIEKAKAVRKILVSGIILIIALVIWYFVYGYVSKFEMKPAELPIEIMTNPEYTYELVSPIQIEFSAERITDKFKKTYDLVSYEWDKEGDGKVDATGQKVTIYFPHGGTNNGIYNVKLLIKMQPKGGGDTIEKDYLKTISISRQDLYGEIEVDRESGEIPLTIKFDADTITDPDDSRILNYSWDLDADSRPDRDGFLYRTTEWTFDTIGEHIVSLTVTSEDFNKDGNHETKIFTKKITVYEPSGSTDTEIWIEANTKKGFAPLSVNFSAQQKATNAKKIKIEKYEWEIGDGMETIRGERSHFTFEKVGVYPVELIVTFANGQIKRDMVEIIVTDESIAPKAIIKTEPIISAQYKALAGPAPFEAKFDASQSKDADDNIVKYDWDFDGDGQWDAEGSIVEHQFLDSGEYKTTLRVTDADGNQSRAEISVKVGAENAVIDFGTNKLSGAAPLTIDFDASGSRVPSGKQIISYEWDFNPSSTGSNKQTFIYERAQTSHIFESIGEHLVKLTLHADDGSEYFDILKIVAAYPSLNAEFSVSRLSGNAPLGISFDASKSTGKIVKLEWIFNDGSTSAEEAPVHIFEKKGIYEVILRVHDSLSNVSQTSKTITVN